MDIVCPNCAAAYRVPDTLLATGKPLRCAACGVEWVPGAIPPAEAPPSRTVAEAGAPAAAGEARAAPTETPEEGEAERPPLITNDPRPPGSRASSRMERPLALGWVASVAAVALALAVMAVYRHEITAAWPPFARIVALLGG